MLKNYGKEAAIMIIAAGLAAYFLPWWSLAIATGLVALFMSQKGSISYAAGLTAGGLVWWAWAMYLDVQNGAILSTRIGQIFQGLTPAELLAATALLGGLIGSMGALTGATLRNILPFFNKSVKASA